MAKSIHELFQEGNNELVSIIDALERLRVIRGLLVLELKDNEELKDSTEFNTKIFNIEMQVLMAECILNEIFPKPFRATIKRRLTFCNRSAEQVGIKPLLYEDLERDCKEMVASYRDKVTELSPLIPEGTD